MKLTRLLILLLITQNTFAQSDSTWQQKPEFKISGFVDVFYVYDFNQPQGNRRQSFLYNHNRHNEFNLNLGLVKLAVDHTKYRANFALQTGTYVNDNYAAEPGFLKSISEANVGISLSKKNKLWLDAGILPSYIGFESAVSSNNYTLTRSLLAENSPYFLTGAKVSYQPNAKWKMSGLLVNGWQRIQRLQGNSLLSGGTQIRFTPSEKTTFNWSTFIGTDDPDSARRMRYFSNLYGQFQIGQKWKMIAGFDIGVQQQKKQSAVYNVWYTPIVIGQYSINQAWKMAIRFEYFNDESSIIIASSNGNSFRTTGLSFNLDYAPSPFIVCRLESRWLNNADSFFVAHSKPSYNNLIIGASIAVKFPEVKLNR